MGCETNVSGLFMTRFENSCLQSVRTNKNKIYSLKEV